MKRVFLFVMVVLMATTAVQAQKMRVMSFNVRNCKGMDNKFNFDRTASVINEAKPTFVAV